MHQESMLTVEFSDVDWCMERSSIECHLHELFGRCSGPKVLTVFYNGSRSWSVTNVECEDPITTLVQQVEAGGSIEKIDSIRFLATSAGYSANLDDFRTLATNRRGSCMKHTTPCPAMLFRTDLRTFDCGNVYLNQKIFLICNGPSFRSVDQRIFQRPGILTFGLNNGAHYYRPSFWVGVDDPCRFMFSIWDDPKIMKFTPISHFTLPVTGKEDSRALFAGDFPNTFGFIRGECFRPENWLAETVITWGDSSMFGGIKSVLLAALKICYLLGFRTIYLVGCDFAMTDGDPYWFPATVSPDYIQNNQAIYSGLIEMLTQLAPHFKAAGVHIYNTNPGSKLKVFPICELSDAIVEAQIDNSTSARGAYESEPG